MSTELKARRDTAANIAAVTPAEGEFGFDTTNKRPIIGDGVRQGAFPVPTIRDVQNQAGVFLTVTGDGSPVNFNVLNGSTGAANNGLTVAALQAGQKFGFYAPGTNTGAVTLNIDSVGAADVELNGVALTGGEIVSGRYYEVVLDSTNDFQLLSGGGGAVELLEVQDVSSAIAAVDMTAFNNSNYSTYILDIENLVPATDSVAIFMRTSTNGGTSFDSSANYGHHTDAFDEAGNNLSDAGSSAAQITCTGSVAMGNAAGETFCAQVIMHEPGNSSRFTSITWAGSYSRSTGSVIRMHGSAMRRVAESVDALRIYAASGNISSGRFLLRGVKQL